MNWVFREFPQFRQSGTQKENYHENTKGRKSKKLDKKIFVFSVFRDFVVKKLFRKSKEIKMKVKITFLNGIAISCGLIL
jgi:hypothetical protein